MRTETVLRALVRLLLLYRDVVQFVFVVIVAFAFANDPEYWPLWIALVLAIVTGATRIVLMFANESVIRKVFR